MEGFTSSSAIFQRILCWTQQDDQRLLQHVAESGTKEWEHALEPLKSAAELLVIRWCALVSSSVKRPCWSQAELALLIKVRIWRSIYHRTFHNCSRPIRRRSRGCHLHASYSAVALPSFIYAQAYQQARPLREDGKLGAQAFYNGESGPVRPPGILKRLQSQYQLIQPRQL